MKLKFKIIISITVLLISMFIIPLLVVNLAQPHTVMGWILLLFFVINPIVAIALGILAGTNIKKLWLIPLLVSIVFPLLYWIVLKEILLELFIYSVIYFIVGLISMLLIALIKKKR